jgi:hypothetical protein
MIKNEEQYIITRKKLSSIHEKIAQIRASHEQLPAKEELILISLITMQEQMKSEIEDYDLYRKT